MSENLKGTRLSRIRDHTDKTLDKMMFAYNSIFFFIVDKGGELVNIEVTDGQYEESYKISRNKHNHLILPMYRIQADVEIKDGFGGTSSGFINGLIKPSINEKSSKVYLHTPVFHFYFEDYVNQEAYLGITTIYETGVVNANTIRWNQKDYQDFLRKYLTNSKSTLPPWFEVRIDKNNISNFMPGFFKYD